MLFYFKQMAFFTLTRVIQITQKFICRVFFFFQLFMFICTVLATS